MGCTELQGLLIEEKAAWAAHKSWKESGGKGEAYEKELTRRSNNASDASTRLRLHFSACSECVGKR